VRKVVGLASVPVAVVVAIVLGFALTGGAGQPKPGVVATSVPLPAVAGRTLGGSSFSPRAYHGHVLVLNFWNPYCAPCRGEATVLDLADGTLAPKGAVLVGVLFSNSTFPRDLAAARRFARELGERYPSIDDASGHIASAFSIRGIPTTVIADAGGTIRYEVFGALKPGELERLVTRVQRR